MSTLALSMEMRLAASGRRKRERDTRDPLDLGGAVDDAVACDLGCAAARPAARLSEVRATGELANNDEVGAADDVTPQRGPVGEMRVQRAPAGRWRTRRARAAA